MLFTGGNGDVIVLIVSLLTSATLAAVSIKNQISKVEGDVEKIADYTLHGAGRHETFNRLATLVDKFGPRQTGSDVLEQAIDYVVEQMKNEGFSNVHKEPVNVPKWVRGNEYAQLIEPRNHSMSILGLGSSVGTNGTVLEADVIVVRTFEELNALNDNVISGKIVVYNQPWLGYFDTVVYRRTGATEAAKRGAVAALIRSLAPFSLVTPHTGQQKYSTDRKIPVACITIEDAEMMKRMQDRGQRIRVRLYMEAMNYPDTVSYNVVGEIPGSEFPHQVVIIGAHLDSWDVGTGSMDDGGGVMIAWQVLSIVKKLGLRPRRTLRLVLWTAEEQGVIGSTEYFRAHNTSTEISNVSIVIESDDGAFKPKGIGFTGSGLALSTMEEIMRLLTKYNTSQVKDGAGESADTGDWIAAGVPGVEILNENENYFYYHHTHADTMTVQDADDLDMCTVVWATVAYVVASLDDLLPRTGDYVVSDAAGSQLHYTSAGSLSIILVLAAVATWFISTGS